jgi:choline dehydrogenase-like flavoprotein
MFYTRAASDDYDKYAELTGDDGWSWDSLQPYFAKNERWIEPHDHHDTTGQFDPAVHSKDGITAVSLAGYPSGIDEMVIDSAHELGGMYEFNLDYNSGDQLGVGKQIIHIASEHSLTRDD